MAWGGLNRFTRHNLFRITPEPPAPFPRDPPRPS
jgi:hypothetical protein